MTARRWITAALVLWMTALPGRHEASGQADAAPGITPGGGQVDGRRIPSYADAWQSYRLDPGGAVRATAVWYDTVSVVERGGRQVLRRVQSIVADGGPTTVLVNEADRVTLLPLRAVARTGDAAPFIDLRFSERRVSGRRPLLPHNGRPGDQLPVDMSLELPGPAWDWRWWGLLVAAMPLERDFSGRFLAFATESSLGAPLLLVTVRVTGEEPVGEVASWVVEVEAGTPWTLWIAKDRAEAPVQRIRVAQPDGGAMVWEPLGSAPAAGLGSASYDPAPRGTRVLENAAGLTITVLVEAMNLGGTEVEVGEIVFPPGTGAERRPHMHGHVEIFYVLAGRLDHIVNGVSHVLEPGRVAVVRPGDQVVHRVIGEHPVRALAIWAPAGELDRIGPFFRERPTQEDPDGR